MFNKVTLIGNLGRDPEVRHFEGGSMVAKFSLATNENYKDRSGEWQTRTEWHDIVCWGGLAQRAESILKKGSLTFVEGKLTTRKWQDKEGNDRYTTEVVAGLIKSLEKRESGSSGSISDAGFPSVEDKYQTAAPSAPAAPTATSTPAEPAGGETSSLDDDLPF